MKIRTYENLQLSSILILTFLAQLSNGSGKLQKRLEASENSKVCFSTFGVHHQRTIESALAKTKLCFIELDLGLYLSSCVASHSYGLCHRRLVRSEHSLAL